MIVRSYRPSDTGAIARLFYHTVHRINSRDYTPEQIAAWAPEPIDYHTWHHRLLAKRAYVTEQDSKIVGFAELDPDGHIDCFYCHSQHQRQGIGTQLLAHLESVARSQNITKLNTEASITARPFFQRQGFSLVQAQQVERRGVWLQNYVMEKYL